MISGRFQQIPTQCPEPSSGVGNNHGSATGTSITAGLPPTAAGRLGHIQVLTPDVPQAAAESLGNMNTERPTTAAMDGDAAGATTPPDGPTMAFLSNASTPAARRSPFAEFQASPARDARVPEAAPAGPESHASRRAAASAKPRAASCGAARSHWTPAPQSLAACCALRLLRSRRRIRRARDGRRQAPREEPGGADRARLGLGNEP